MTKDEARLAVMDAISMALKDPTLQQGFEIICKENADLKIYNEKLLDSDIEKHNKIVKLKQRNAELAGQKASLGRWFAEAKALLKRWGRLYNTNTVKGIITDTKNFLEETE